MTKILAAAALAALIATPALAQSMKSEGSGAGLKSYAASDSQKAKAKKKKLVTYTQPRRVLSYSGNPEFDVYVRGEYVGSDPDPRIRATLRDEAKRYYGVRD
jgi:opacity protein-like surface antigen